MLKVDADLKRRFKLKPAWFSQDCERMQRGEADRVVKEVLELKSWNGREVVTDGDVRELLSAELLEDVRCC